MAVELELRPPSVPEYQALRATTGWDEYSDATVKTGLGNSLFGVVALHRGQVIGCGRVVGDGALYFYIQDMIVDPSFKGRGIGKRLMQALMDWLDEHVPENGFVGLMAAKDVSEFYGSFGFRPRPGDAPGMYRIWKRDQE